MSFDPLPWSAAGAAASPAFSADGKTLFHVRGLHGRPWAQHLDTGEARLLADPGERVTLLRRAPADDRLVYGFDRGGDERLQLWLLDGEPRPLTHRPDAVHAFGAWSPDGQAISFAANDADPARFALYTLDLATGARRQFLDVPGELAPGAWHPDGTRFLAVHDRSSGDQRVLIVDAASGAAQEIPRQGARFASVRWAEGRLLALTDAGRDMMALCELDPATGDATPVHAPDGRDVEVWSMAPGGAALATPGRAALATIENDRGWSVLRIGPPTGERPVVAGLPPGVLSDLAWSQDGKQLAVVASSPTGPAGLWLVEDGKPRPLWQPDPPGPCIVPELVEWQAQDGRAVPGWLAYPAGEPPAAGWPAIVWVHGGPASQTRPNFRGDMQALLAQGYALLMPNVRGSTGYGRAAMDSDDLGKRLDAVEDLVAGGRWLAARPDIDATRIAVMGQSYGGYMVLAALVEAPELWRAGIDFYGIGDFTTLLAGTGPWRRAHRATEYGDPAHHRALFGRISPLRRFDRLRAPLLVLHGTRDPRVPFEESVAVVDALERRGHPVAFERFDYAGHGFLRPEDRARAFAAVAAFLERTMA